jgi:prolyl-tRNA synthetase
LESLQKVATPGAKTIATLSRHLNIRENQTAKAAFFMAGERLIFAVVRGDMDVNETKLLNALGGGELRPARIEELEGTGIVPGYASPIGVSGAVIVVDELVARSANLVAGANEEGYHLLNTNVPRDYQAHIVTDIADVFAGAPCIQCGTPLELARAVEVGNIFKLGTKYTEALGATFLDEEGVAHPVVMASYGIGVGRLMASVAEACRDDAGLMWPVTLSPFDVYLVGLDLDDETVRHAAETLFSRLTAAGVEVLFDDRGERAGVKFKDADLLGMPIRATVSRRTVAAGSVEIAMRGGKSRETVPSGEAVTVILAELSQLRHAVVVAARRSETLDPTEDLQD